MMPGNARPILLLISAPSGAGKTTLCDRLRREFANMVYSVSCTTRPPRKGEVDGRDYHFLAEPEFRRRIEAGFFLECAEVHGYWYGTPRRPVEEALAAGRDVLLAIDVQGAARIRKLISAAPDSSLSQAFVDVFVVPPDLAALKERLEKRGQDDQATIGLRLKNAGREMALQREYRYLVVNDLLDAAYDRLRAIVLAEHCRVAR